MLEARDLSFSVKGNSLLQSVSYSFTPGKHYAICGPNGAGKSTFLKLLGLELQPTSGIIYLNDTSLTIRNASFLSRQRAVLSQHLDIAFPLTVKEVVMMGRYPYSELFTESHNEKICSEVMQWLDVSEFAERDYNTLSGGEKQRVQFARVLAQIWEVPPGKTRMLLLDEPVTYLDLKHQLDFLQKVKQLVDEQTIVISILHDMNLILQYADEVLLMHHGKLYASGRPQQVLTTGNIKTVFEVNSHLAEIQGKTFLWVG